MEKNTNNKVSKSPLPGDSGSLKIWQFIKQKLIASTNVILLWVVENEGSSPGRQGFKIAVSADGDFTGTIGGGIMEHKLVEKAKGLLKTGATEIFLMRQFHDKQHTTDQSGMICSGQQVIAFVPFGLSHLPAVENVLENSRNKTVWLTKHGLRVEEKEIIKPGFQYLNENEWEYNETVDSRPVIHIIGAGHAGLALSQLMTFLNFYVKIYDNRPHLNTLISNQFANEKLTVDYQRISETIVSNKNEFIVIMTFGYRDDKTVFKELLDKTFFYSGMMGSDAKIKILLEDVKNEGISPALWAHWHMPIGLPIYSKTAEEIAISIAAEIILEKNKALPTGRRKRNQDRKR